MHGFCQNRTIKLMPQYTIDFDAREQLRAIRDSLDHARLYHLNKTDFLENELSACVSRCALLLEHSKPDSGQIVHKLTHGEPEGWPDPVAMQEAWERDDAIELVTDKRIARKYADSIIEWIAGPVPWQEWERVDMADAILRAIQEAKGIASTESNPAIRRHETERADAELLKTAAAKSEQNMAYET